MTDWTIKDMQDAKEAINHVNDTDRFMLFHIRQCIKDVLDTKIAELTTTPETAKQIEGEPAEPYELSVYKRLGITSQRAYQLIDIEREYYNQSKPSSEDVQRAIEFIIHQQRICGDGTSMSYSTRLETIKMYNTILAALRRPMPPDPNACATIIANGTKYPVLECSNCGAIFNEIKVDNGKNARGESHE